MKNWVELYLVLCGGKCFVKELFAILGSVRGQNPSELSTKLESHVVSAPSLAWNDKDFSGPGRRSSAQLDGDRRLLSLPTPECL